MQNKSNSRPSTLAFFVTDERLMEIENIYMNFSNTRQSRREIVANHTNVTQFQNRYRRILNPPEFRKISKTTSNSDLPIEIANHISHIHAPPEFLWS